MLLFPAGLQEEGLGGRLPAKGPLSIFWNASAAAAAAGELGAGVELAAVAARGLEWSAAGRRGAWGLGGAAGGLGRAAGGLGRAI